LPFALVTAEAEALTRARVGEGRIVWSGDALDVVHGVNRCREAVLLTLAVGGAWRIAWPVAAVREVSDECRTEGTPRL
jgi:hypothetical protein